MSRFFSSSIISTRFFSMALVLFLGGMMQLVAKTSPLAQIKPETPKEVAPLSPWMKPRELSNFENLMQHSPFSLATAEESSPLSERYSVTGIIKLNGEEEIFVLDRKDQSRELVTAQPNTKAMSLVKIIPDKDPNKLKATIRVNGETGTIVSLEPSTNNPTGGQHLPGPNGANNPNFPKNTVHPPGAIYYPGQALAPYHSGQPSPSTLPNSGAPSNIITTNSPDHHRVINRPPVPGQLPYNDNQ